MSTPTTFPLEQQRAAARTLDTEVLREELRRRRVLEQARNELQSAVGEYNRAKDYLEHITRTIENEGETFRAPLSEASKVPEQVLEKTHQMFCSDRYCTGGRACDPIRKATT